MATLGLIEVPSDKQRKRCSYITHISQLPESYDTLVGERGVSLSGGQRQRLAIARGVLPGSGVFIFDDSTAAIDAGTEQQIRSALKEATAKRATIIIAHRLSSLRHADEIMFLVAGQVVERGTHETLLALNGRYAALYRMQTVAVKSSVRAPVLNDIEAPNPKDSKTEELHDELAT